MTVLRRLAMVALLLVAPAFAGDVAELRNGFTIPHHARELRDGQMRLYLDEQRTTFVDVAATEITGYHWEADVVAAGGQAANSGNATAPQKDTRQIVAEASDLHGVDADFIRSVIRQESGGNPKAISRTGARGLMQLMPATAEQLGVKDSFSAEQNVHGGAEYLRTLLEHYHGDAILALAAYNAGPQAVERYHGVPPYRETQQYVRRVVHDYNRSKGAAASGVAKQAAKSTATCKNTQAPSKADTAKLTASAAN